MKNKDEEKKEIAVDEEEILKFWEKNEIFKKSNEKKAPNGEFIFFEGPPTANGRPGIHHMLARVFKDVILRYKTMRGYHIRRKAGWDTHGLPVEIAVEKELGLKSKKEIEEYGIAEFNKRCKESVWKHIDEWEKFTERIAFWLDEKHPYITYEPEYMESVWYAVKKANEQKLLYKDYRIVNWCPRCGTGLSSHELAQGYKEIDDESVYVKFKVKDSKKHNLQEDTYLLAWTTTPWTLPGNTALAINKNIKYKILKIDNENLILAEDRIEKIIIENKKYEILGDINIKALLNLEYEPLYSYLEKESLKDKQHKINNAYKIYSADFVTTKDGTGIVHIALMYGADDFKLGSEKNLPKIHLVDEDGRFIKGTGFLEGKKVRGANEEIIKNLDERDLLFKKERVKHTYPFCWRCNTALLYYARDSWYIRMSDLRDKLVEENDSINWEPKHIKEGRFGEWLREVKDWAVSRERYWATPLPVWQNEKRENIVIGSIDELKKYTKKSGNKYFVMRHGEAENNTLGIISSNVKNKHHLTKKGKEQTAEAIKELNKKKIDIIISSPFARTRETAQMVADGIGIDKKQIIIDERIQELQAGEFDGKTVEEYHKSSSLEMYFEKRCPGGESCMDIKNRTGAFIYDIESRYIGKNILIITHDAPGWLLLSAVAGYDAKKTIASRGNKEHFIKNAEIKDFDFVPLPHNENYELDLHRPYIDEIEFEDEKGNKLERVKEVLDVWFDSGAMPFAQDHYPFENKNWIERVGYPADFISEAVDQTRGWFYTLHAIGNLMGRGKAYKNVISLGHILDNKGKKMSKSVGNVINPWETIDRYGVDAIRFWMYAVNQPGDSKNFDEKSVDEAVKKVFNLLNNIVKFYQLYADTDNLKFKIKNLQLKNTNTLDLWILARLNKLIADSTKNMDEYNVFEPARAIREFVADFSQWYIRRSRERFKTEGEDKERALATTRFVLLELSKLMAPFMPFIAEQIYQKVRDIDMQESVHLTSWQEELKVGSEELEILDDMEITRKIVSLGLEARLKAGIKVRQPLATLRIANQELKIKNKEGLLQLIKDEVNVKEILFFAEGKSDLVEDAVELDTNLTQELKDEGALRELIRAIQSARKEANLTPRDFVNIDIETDEIGKMFIKKFANTIKTNALIKEINLNAIDDEKINTNQYNFKFKIKQ